MFNKLLCFCSLTIIPMFVIGQHSNDEYSYENYFGSLTKPIEIKVEPFNDKYQVKAYNSTLYPFTTTIELSLDNMRCDRSLSFNHLIFPGSNIIAELIVIDNRIGHSYSFKFNYKVGNPTLKLNDTITYLIPLKPGKSYVANPSNCFTQNYSFVCSKGDTIYASRKGLVCATPLDSKDFVDRYAFSNNFEVYQNDGTLAVYTPLSSVFKKRGETVLPGEAIGVAAGDFFFLHILQFNVNSGINYASVKFITEEGRFTSFRRDETIRPIHPESIIINELTKREKKKRKK